MWLENKELQHRALKRDNLQSLAFLRRKALRDNECGDYSWEDTGMLRVHVDLTTVSGYDQCG